MGKQEIVSIPMELYEKLKEHADQKKIKVDQEVTEMLELGIDFLGTLYAAKRVTENAEMEL